MQRKRTLRGEGAHSRIKNLNNSKIEETKSPDDFLLHGEQKVIIVEEVEKKKTRPMSKTNN